MSSLALISPSSSTTSQASSLSSSASCLSTSISIISSISDQVFKEDKEGIEDYITACDGCGLTTDSHLLRRCSRCKAKWYCSSRCQQEDWHIHKYCCSLLPTQLETWRGNRTSVFGADYMKRLQLCTEWSNAPLDDDFCVKNPAYRKLVRHEKKSPFKYQPGRKVRRYETPAYILVSLIRMFLMHDISSVGKLELEIVAKLIMDPYHNISGVIYFHGSKTISRPDKLSSQEYLNLAEIWPSAFKLIAHINPEYEDAVKYSENHWKVIKVLNKKLNKMASGPIKLASCH